MCADDVLGCRLLLFLAAYLLYNVYLYIWAAMSIFENDQPFFHGAIARVDAESRLRAARADGVCVSACRVAVFRYFCMCLFVNDVSICVSQLGMTSVSGAYLIRMSTSSHGSYVLSILFQQEGVLHFQIKNQGEVCADFACYASNMWLFSAGLVSTMALFSKD